MWGAKPFFAKIFSYFMRIKCRFAAIKHSFLAIKRGFTKITHDDTKISHDNTEIKNARSRNCHGRVLLFYRVFTFTKGELLLDIGFLKS